MSSLRKWFGRAGPQGDVSLNDAEFRQLAEGSADVMFRIGHDHVAKYVSPSCTRVFGWTPAEMIGLGPESFVHPPDLPKLNEMAARIDGGMSDGEVTVFRIGCKDGRLIWVESNSHVLPPSPTAMRGDLVVTMRDITERKMLEDQLARLADTDGLTGLANRRAFDRALELAWKNTLSAAGSLSLLLLDVDRFKAFNDTYGHQVGDDCLRAIAAELMKADFARGATIARYGGEELAIILPDVGAEAGCLAAETARRAVEGLGLPHAENVEGGGRVTVSVGAATALARAGGTMQMPGALLAAADTALYKAKRGGRNRVEAALMLAAP